MDFKNIPSNYYPAYAWAWNTAVTREGIRSRIDYMCDCGIRAFYVIAEPERFRPRSIRTHLKPQYLSEEYFELLFYASDYAHEKGMYVWYYNEGGWPSGGACGQVVDRNPDVLLKQISKKELFLKKGAAFAASENHLSAFCDNKRIYPGDKAAHDCTVYEYFWENICGIFSDVADKRTLPVFTELTYNKFAENLKRYKDSGKVLMFDDEAQMFTWTKNMDRIFSERFGYDMTDYIPYIYGDKKPETFDEHKALKDYFMLCGELVRENYFTPTKKWLNKHNMLLAGHLNNENIADGCVVSAYGNILKTLRCFDVPGIDVIWNQITFPGENGYSVEGNEFFPRFAASAARQNGSRISLSESFAVYGSQLTCEEMRYVINYQAVMGINLFNFMIMSYDEEHEMSLQFRPNFIKQNPGTDCMSEINGYTARLSYILQNSESCVDTALYYPAASICAGGDIMKEAVKNYDEAGKMLEEQGIAFDIIDEDFVLNSVIKDGAVCGEHVSYKNVCIPHANFEDKRIFEKLGAVSSCAKPCIIRKNRYIKALKKIYDEKEIYFIVNTGNEKVSENIGFYSNGTPFEVNLLNGNVYDIDFQHRNGKIFISAELLRGEGKMIIFDEKGSFKGTVRKEYGYYCTLKNFDSYISREYVLDSDKPYNLNFKHGETHKGLYEWAADFSGEVTYFCKFPEDMGRTDILLDLGEVRYFAKVFVNGRKYTITMPPYTLEILDVCGGDEIKIVVSNTIANRCAGNSYFSLHDIADIGPYNENMQIHEKKALPGGLLGPVGVFIKEEDEFKK